MLEVIAAITLLSIVMVPVTLMMASSAKLLDRAARTDGENAIRQSLRSIRRTVDRFDPPSTPNSVTTYDADGNSFDYSLRADELVCRVNRRGGETILRGVDSWSVMATGSLLSFALRVRDAQTSTTFDYVLNAHAAGQTP